VLRDRDRRTTSDRFLNHADDQTGNLNAPAIMIGEKGADHVRGRPPLPAANVPVYAAANWQAAQR
jgi:hypothetical protein